MAIEGVVVDATGSGIGIIARRDLIHQLFLSQRTASGGELNGRRPPKKPPVVPPRVWPATSQLHSRRIDSNGSLSDCNRLYLVTIMMTFVVPSTMRGKVKLGLMPLVPWRRM